MKNATVAHRQELANVFDALGHHRRIAIIQELQLAGKDGLTFGNLVERTDMPASALKHHIRMMKRGGIVYARIKGSFTMLMLDMAHLSKALSSFR